MGITGLSPVRCGVSSLGSSEEMSSLDGRVDRTFQKYIAVIREEDGSRQVVLHSDPQFQGSDEVMEQFLPMIQTGTFEQLKAWLRDFESFSERDRGYCVILAAAFGKEDWVKVLLENGNISNEDAEEAFASAAETGYVTDPLMKLLNVQVSDEIMCAALIAAAENQHLNAKMIRTLSDNGITISDAVWTEVIQNIPEDQKSLVQTLRCASIQITNHPQIITAKTPHRRRKTLLLSPRTKEKCTRHWLPKGAVFITEALGRNSLDQNAISERFKRA